MVADSSTDERRAMTTAAATPAERDRLKGELEARRAKLRVEVKAQLAGSDDDRVVGLRNRIEESGDEWGVADGLAELDLAEARARAGGAHRGRRRARADARRKLWRMRGLRRRDRAGAARGLPDRAALRQMPGRLREEGERAAADGGLAAARSRRRGDRDRAYDEACARSRSAPPATVAPRVAGVGRGFAGGRMNHPKPACEPASYAQPPPLRKFGVTVSRARRRRARSAPPSRRIRGTRAASSAASGSSGSRRGSRRVAPAPSSPSACRSTGAPA